jgi:hypothetical protein
MPSKSALGIGRQQPSKTKAPERYLFFGPFKIDLQREELFKEGSRVRILSKVFKCWRSSLNGPAKIVTREGVARAAVATRNACEL